MSHSNGHSNGHSNRARKVAVIAHTGKQLGGGLGELRTALHDEGIPDPLWVEVTKSRYAPKEVRAALKAGVDLVIVWGGDGMVQQCVTELAGTDTPMAIMPAGTANLLASNLSIPSDVEKALHTFERALRLNPCNFNAHRNLMMLYSNRNQRQAAWEAGAVPATCTMLPDQGKELEALRRQVAWH